MPRQTINVPGLSKAGPYSHVVRCGGLLFLSGQIPVDAAGQLVKGDIATATELVLGNVGRILDHCGSSLKKAVKVTVFLTDMASFGAMNAVYSRFFPEDQPVRTCVAVGALPAGAEIEIEVVAAE